MDPTQTVNVPAWFLVAALNLVIGFAVGWFLARWYQRKRSAGLTKDQIIDLGKATVAQRAGDALVKARAEYEEALAIAKKKAEEINILARGGGG
jgi:hypothetical protein